MKEKYELIGHGNSAHLIRKYKKHWWNKWQIEMDGENCVHDYEFVEIVRTVSFPAGIPMRLLRCTKCGHERVTRL